MDRPVEEGGTTGRFTPENELESLLLEATRGSRLTDRLISALRSSTLFALGEATPPGNYPDRSTTVRLYGVNVEGDRVIPLFTAESRISEYIRTEQPYIGLPGRELFRLVGQEARVVVNPASACGMELLSDDIQRIVTQDP